MRRVEYFGAQARQMNPRDISEVLGDSVVGVLDSGLVVACHFGEHVRAFQYVQTSLANVLGDSAGADGLAIDRLEGLDGLVAKGLLLHAVHDSIAFQVANGGHGDASFGHRPGKALAYVHAGQNVLSIRIEDLHCLCQPALGANPVRLGCVPDVHATEVRPVGIRISYALNDRHLAFVVEPLERRGVSVNGKVIVNGQNLLLS